MPSSRPPRAVLYVRISELTDATTSPERQRADAQAYAERAGIQVVEEFEDLDISGRKDLTKRPGLAAALQAVEEGRADVLIAAKVDRVARSVITFHEVVRRLDEAGGALVSVAEGLDFSTPSGRMVANVLATFAQFESETIGARVKSAQEHLREVGKWRGGRRPFGWRPEPHESGKGHVLKPDPEESAILLELVERVLDGEGIYALARDLNERGVLTAQGKGWHYQTVRQVLSKRSLIGDHGADALLDEKTYAKLQVALNTDKRREPVTGPRGLLPLDLVFCGGCGGPMRAARKGKDSDAYVCATPKRPGVPGCWVSAKVPHVDAVVEGRLLDALGRLPASFQTAPEVEDLYSEEREELLERLGELETDRYVRGLFPGDDGAERFARIYGDLRARLDDLPGPTPVEGSGVTVPSGAGFAEAWAKADDEVKAGWLRAALDHIEIGPGKGGRRFDEDRIALHWSYSDSVSTI